MTEFEKAKSHRQLRSEAVQMRAAGMDWTMIEHILRPTYRVRQILRELQLEEAERARGGSRK